MLRSFWGREATRVLFLLVSLNRTAPRAISYSHIRQHAGLGPLSPRFGERGYYEEPENGLGRLFTALPFGAEANSQFQNLHVASRQLRLELIPKTQPHSTTPWK